MVPGGWWKKFVKRPGSHLNNHLWVPGTHYIENLSASLLLLLISPKLHTLALSKNNDKQIKLQCWVVCFPVSYKMSLQQIILCHKTGWRCTFFSINWGAVLRFCWWQMVKKCGDVLSETSLGTSWSNIMFAAGCNRICGKCNHILLHSVFPTILSFVANSKSW